MSHSEKKQTEIPKVQNCWEIKNQNVIVINPYLLRYCHNGDK